MFTSCVNKPPFILCLYKGVVNFYQNDDKAWKSGSWNQNSWTHFTSIYVTKVSAIFSLIKHLCRYYLYKEILSVHWKELRAENAHLDEKKIQPNLPSFHMYNGHSSACVLRQQFIFYFISS